jgi:hypothetical protein
MFNRWRNPQVAEPHKIASRCAGSTILWSHTIVANLLSWRRRDAAFLFSACRMTTQDTHRYRSIIY